MQLIPQLIPRACRRLIRGANLLQPVFLLLVRLYWGWQFFLTGKGKLLNLDGTADYFQQLSIPLPKFNALMAGATECGGGLLLLLGLGSRLISIPLSVTMLVAYLTAHPEELKMIFTDSDKFVTAPPFLFLFASLVSLIFGPGRFSADHWIQRRFFTKPGGG